MARTEVRILRPTPPTRPGPLPWLGLRWRLPPVWSFHGGLAVRQGQDLAHIRAFYADKTGLHPALAGKIRLRDDL